MLLTTKQVKGEITGHFYGKLNELSENCELRKQKHPKKRQLTVNMQDSEIQKKLVKETVEPTQAFSLAINMKLGQQNQVQISDSQSSLQKVAAIPQSYFRNLDHSQNFRVQTRRSNQMCRKCGLTWSANYKGKRIAKNKTCNNCDLQNHFVCVCRNSKSTSIKPACPKVNSIHNNTTDISANVVSTKNYNPEIQSDYDSSDHNMVASIASITLNFEPKNTILQIDSGSVSSILNESLLISCTMVDIRTLPQKISKVLPMSQFLQLA